MKFIKWLVGFLILIMDTFLFLPFSIDFKLNCSYYMKRAADANTIEMAIPEMEKVVSYIEERGLTDGYTHLFIKTPAGDLSFWHRNLKAALAELKSVKPDASQLEKANILMKLRETLLDKGEQGEEVTVPDNTAYYPHQRLILFSSVFFSIVLFLYLVGSVLTPKKATFQKL